MNSRNKLKIGSSKQANLLHKLNQLLNLYSNKLMIHIIQDQTVSIKLKFQEQIQCIYNIGLWISYLLMEKESRNLLIEFESNVIMHNLLPLKLQMIDIVGRRFEEIL